MPQDSFRGLPFPAMLLAPLPKELPEGTRCSECDRPQSKWFLQPLPGIAPICSLCVLYKVPWEGKQEADIEAYIAAVEANVGEFEKDSEGRLMHCRDADRLIFSLVLTGKVMHMSKNRGRK
jgi:hypothetical protein